MAEFFSGSIPHKIKIIGAVLLAVAFFLPLSRCDTTIYTPDNQEQTGSEVIYEYFYAYDNIRLEEPGSYLIPVLFFWPTLFLAYAIWGRRQGLKTGLTFIGPILSVIGGYVIVLMSLFSEVYIGTYVALAGVVGFFVGSGIEAIQKIKFIMESTAKQ